MAGLLLSVGVAGCNRGGAPPMTMPPAPVTTAAAVARDVPVYLDEIGKCAAWEMVSVTPQVAGRVMQIRFKEGDDVHKGDDLVDIDARPFQAALDQANADLQQANATLTFAKSDLARGEIAYKGNAISKEDYETKQNAVEVAAARVEAGKAEVETANLNLEYCKIKAPIDGRAGQKLIDVGNVVKANEGTLLTIQKIDPMYADFTITERDLPEVRRHMAEGTLKVLVWLPQDAARLGLPGGVATPGGSAPATQPAAAGPSANAAQPAADVESPSTAPAMAEGPNTLQQPREGDLEFLDNAVQDGSGTVKLRARINNADRHFWPGQFVNVRLVLMVKKDAVLIPDEAVQTGQNGLYVYVVKDSKAELRPVTTGQSQTGGLVVVDSGVKTGEQVVTTGQLAVMPGGPVRVLSPQPSGAPGQPMAKAD